MGTSLKFYEEPKFKELQSKWYGKLKKKNFLDEEKFIGGELRLINHSLPNYIYNLCPLTREARLRYFILIGQCVSEEDFENDRDRLILLLQSEGTLIRDIVNELQVKGYNCHRQTVRYIIRKFEHKWKIRTWQKQQMTSNLVTA